MSKKNLKDRSKEELEKLEKSHKTIIGIFIPIILGLIYFIVRNYVRGEELDWATLTIAICTLGGPASIYPELKKVQEELKSRS